jgi:hypothetical protein
MVEEGFTTVSHALRRVRHALPLNVRASHAAKISVAMPLPRALPDTNRCLKGFIYCLALSLLPAFGGQILVPTDQPTIQQGINAAIDGDTVLVSPGVYHETISIFSKRIAVVSAAGPKTTIIDAQRAGTVVAIAGFVAGSQIRLEGFTIENGTGGIVVWSGSPTIVGNIITNNVGCDCVGVDVEFSSPLILSNVITGNFRSGCFGGIGGGGIGVKGAGAVQIVHNIITNNSTTRYGGGIALYSAGNPLIRDNFIAWNVGESGGGVGIVNDSTSTFLNNVFVGNHASGAGGGIYSSVPGGARGPYIINNTFADNFSSAGSAIYSDGFDSSSVFENNIMVAYSNQTALYLGTFFDVPQPQMTNNDIISPLGKAFDGRGPNPVGTNGNFSLTPGFLDPEVLDYRLRANSPAIDAGSNDGATTNDLDGVARPFDGDGNGIPVADAGAYEWIPHPPAAPLNLSGYSVDLQSFLAWRATPETDLYFVGRSTNSGGPYQFMQAVSSTNFVDTAVVRDVVYYYEIQASNVFGLGQPSAEFGLKAGELPPSAMNDFVTTLEDTPITIFALTNDTDPNNDSLTLMSFKQPQNGTVVINGAGFQYSPLTNYNGTNSFSYIIADGRGMFSTGLVTVVVTPVNDAPHAFNTTISIPGDSLGQVLSLQVQDVDGDPLTYEFLTLPTNGVLNIANRFYRPTHAYVGVDSLLFRVNDGITNSETARVMLNVTAPIDLNHDGIPDLWANQHGITNATDDPDRDGMNNLQEYLANTDPTNGASMLKLLSLTITSNFQATIAWASSGGTRYRVQTVRGDLRQGFVDIVRSASEEIAPGSNGVPSTMSFTDMTSPTNVENRFYRVKAVTK